MRLVKDRIAFWPGGEYPALYVVHDDTGNISATFSLEAEADRFILDNADEIGADLYPEVAHD